MAALLWFTAAGAKQLSSVLSRENRVISLQAELNDERKANAKNGAAARQFGTAVANAKLHISALNVLVANGPTVIADQAPKLAQRIIDSLAADLKHTPGELHRCALWLRNEETDLLYPVYVSAGFPHGYIESKRTLKCWYSLAGKAVRLRQTVKVDNVHDNDEWEENPNSNSPYNALICVPLSNGKDIWGVVTMDALAPFTSNDVLIGELYAVVLEAVVNHYARNMAAETERSA